jgi:hypothetical protein
MLVQGSL